MKKILMLAVTGMVFMSPAAIAGHHNDGDHKGKMFEKMDTNNDGVITKDEFMSKHEQKFNEMDADNNGEVTREEAKAAMEKWRGKMKDRKENRKDSQDGKNYE